MDPAASGRGLSDINSVYYRVKSRVKNGKSSHGENIPILIQIEKARYWFIFFVQGLPSSDT